MNETNRNTFVALQTVIVFCVGVLGNKLAELLHISPMAVLSLSVILLTIHSVVSARAATGHVAGVEATSPGLGERDLTTTIGDESRRRPTPAFLRTVGGMFSVGLACGIIVDAVLVRVPEFNGYSMNFLGVGSHIYETVGIVIGMLAMFVTAGERSGTLALGLGIGYAMGCSTALVTLLPEHNDAIRTYGGQLAWFLSYGLLLILIRRDLKWFWRTLKSFITSPRDDP